MSEYPRLIWSARPVGSHPAPANLSDGWGFHMLHSAHAIGVTVETVTNETELHRPARYGYRPGLEALILELANRSDPYRTGYAYGFVNVENAGPGDTVRTSLAQISQNWGQDEYSHDLAPVAVGAYTSTWQLAVRFGSPISTKWREYWQIILPHGYIDTEDGIEVTGTITSGGRTFGISAIKKASRRLLRWSGGPATVSIEARLRKSAVGLRIVRDGKTLSQGSMAAAYSGPIRDGDTIRIAAAAAKDVCLPLFGDILSNTHLPLIGDLTKPYTRPLYAAFTGDLLTYWLKGGSNHLWTAVTTQGYNPTPWPNDCFTGRTEWQPGSGTGSERARGVQFRPTVIAKKAPGVQTTADSITVSGTFWCALCNWGCMGSITEAPVDFVVGFRAHQQVIKKSTAPDPTLSALYPAFDFTLIWTRIRGYWILTSVTVTLAEN